MNFTVFFSYILLLTIEVESFKIAVEERAYRVSEIVDAVARGVGVERVALHLLALSLTCLTLLALLARPRLNN